MDVRFRLTEPQKARRFFHKGPCPVLHVYPSGGRGRVAVRIPLTLEHFTDWSTVHVNANARAVCFDLYVSVANDNCRWCTMHAASTTMYLDGDRTNAVLRNTKAGYELGRIEAQLVTATQHTHQRDDDDDDDDEASAQSLASAEFTLLDNKTPLDPFIASVNMPYFRGRCGVLPGPAYFAAFHDTVAPTDNWWRAQLHLAARRLNVRVADWSLAVDRRAQHVDGFHRAAQLVFEAVASAVTALPYCGDFYVDAQAKRIQFESFDNFFVRECGDCEDGSRAVLQLVTHLQRHTGSARTPVGRMATVARLYAPCAVLGVVSAAAWGKAHSVTPQAHMFTFMVPKAQLYAKAHVDYSGSPFEAQLKTWCVEATAPVEPFTDVASAKQLFPATHSHYERTRAQQTLPLKSMQRLYRPSLVQQVETAFYKTSVHLYTSVFLDDPKGPNVAAFTFMPTGQHDKYAVAFETSMTGDYDLLPHVEYSDEELRKWKEHFTLEHPAVTLRQGNSLRELPPGFAEAGARHEPPPSDVYSDYLVGDVHDLSPADWEYARQWFDRQGPHEACWEGWDCPTSQQLRVRVYKKNV